MAITKTNVFYGPLTATGTGGTGWASGSLVPGAISWGTETKRMNRGLEDGNEKNKEIGQILTVVITFDDITTTNIANIIACTAWAIACANPGKTLTIAASDYLKNFAEIVDGKLQITIIKTLTIGAAITSLFTWA